MRSPAYYWLNYGVIRNWFGHDFHLFLLNVPFDMHHIPCFFNIGFCHGTLLNRIVLFQISSQAITDIQILHQISPYWRMTIFCWITWKFTGITAPKVDWAVGGRTGPRGFDLNSTDDKKVLNLFLPIVCRICSLGYSPEGQEP